MSEIQVNTINEYTSGNGVSVDGLSIKDGQVTDFMFDIWRQTADRTGSATDYELTSNWERVDDLKSAATNFNLCVEVSVQSKEVIA